MKTKTIFITIIGLLAVTVLVFQSCNKEDPVNQNPTCTITSPTNGQEIAKGETVTISITATASDGSIAKVEFFVDNKSKGSATNPPFEYNWNTNGESIGNHTIKATSTDNSGGSASDEISVEIKEAGGWISGTFTDPRDGKTYLTTSNGDQTWFSEDLYFDTTSSERNHEKDYAETGSYYNWQSARTACPSGWHLPTDEEWKELEMSLYMLQSEADGIGWRGNVQGYFLKSEEGWINYGHGSDRIGFKALPNGYMNDEGELIQKDTTAVFWTATFHSSTESAWFRQLHYIVDQVMRSSTSSTARFSVRCVKN